VTVEGPSAAVVADALAGRSSIDRSLPEVGPSSRAALTRVAVFFNTPVEKDSI
jgi:hypothetical protein